LEPAAAEKVGTMSARSFAVTGRMRGHGERTIRWTADGGFDDPTGLIRYLILAGAKVRLSPDGPAFTAADDPDLVALVTARALFDEIIDERIEGEITEASLLPHAVT
jgi:hypothetical protein